MRIFKPMADVFQPRSGALAFFTSIVIWGIGIGCFMATVNNFLAEIHEIGKLERGWLEFFREMPGVLLVLLLAGLHRFSDWKIMRLGTLVSMAGVALLCIPANKALVTFLIMIWSTGEHLVMPVRTAIALQVAKPGQAGQSLGLVTSAMNGGTVLGSMMVAAIFWFGANRLAITNRLVLYNVVWGMIFVLMLVSFVCTFTRNAPEAVSKRPRLYFNRKFTVFYLLELFYGARKQIFLTFAPYVLIVHYGLQTSQIALLMGICAAVNIFGSPLIGRLTDRVGYRNVMIYDTVVLFFVCLLYGFADQLFPPRVAVIVVCLNFLFDAVISTTALAASLYVRDITSSREEVTSTLATGISINHVISIAAGPLGGWVWQQWGIAMLFSFSALMAIANTLCAMLIPKPVRAGKAKA